MAEKSDLEILEANFEDAKRELSELNHQAWMTMKSLNDKTGKTDFDPIRYKERKRNLQELLPIIQSRLLKERIRVTQSRREQAQQELDGLQPLQLETKARFIEAQKILEEAWRQHALIDLKAASLESQLQIDFQSLRADQRSLQELISQITGIAEEDTGVDGPSSTDNILIRD